MPLVLLSSNNNMSLKLKKKRSLASHVPPLFISGVTHPFLMVVLLQHSDELPALDPSLTKVYVPCLAFWCLCINVKLPPPVNNTVMLISLVLYLFLSRCCSVFLYTVSFLLLTVMTCICLIPPPPSPFFFSVY